jgi:hypothetical protein
MGDSKKRLYLLGSLVLRIQVLWNVVYSVSKILSLINANLH